MSWLLAKLSDWIHDANPLPPALVAVAALAVCVRLMDRRPHRSPMKRTYVFFVVVFWVLSASGVVRRHPDFGEMAAGAACLGGAFGVSLVMIRSEFLMNRLLGVVCSGLTWAMIVPIAVWCVRRVDSVFTLTWWRWSLFWGLMLALPAVLLWRSNSPREGSPAYP